MTHSALQSSRLVVGVILIVVAVLLFAFAQGTFSTAGGVALAVLGLVSIVISRHA